MYEKRLPYLTVSYYFTIFFLLYHRGPYRCSHHILIDRDSFANAIMLARENIVFRHRPRVLLTKGGIVCGILLDDIMYMESNGRMITVYTSTSSETFQYKLESIKPSLDARFVHCHKSFIVNMDYASKLDTVNMTFYLRSGIQVPVSTRRVKDVRTAFRDYIMPY